MIQDLKQKKWYIINDLNNDQYGNGNENESTVKFSTDILKMFLVDYSDAYILVTGDIKVLHANDATRVAFKNCHPFTRAITRLNDKSVETAYHLYVTMNLFNLINYSENVADTTASLKRPDLTRNNNGAVTNITNSSISFDNQWELIKNK